MFYISKPKVNMKILLLVLLSLNANAFNAGDKVRVTNSLTGFYNGCEGVITSPGYLTDQEACGNVYAFSKLTCKGKEIYVGGLMCEKSLELITKLIKFTRY